MQTISKILKSHTFRLDTDRLNLELDSACEV